MIYIKTAEINLCTYSPDSVLILPGGLRVSAGVPMRKPGWKSAGQPMLCTGPCALEPLRECSMYEPSAGHVLLYQISPLMLFFRTTSCLPRKRKKIQYSIENIIEIKRNAAGQPLPENAD